MRTCIKCGHTFNGDVCDKCGWEHKSFSDLLLESANAGDAESQVLLGQIYYNGKGVPADSQEGIKWLQLAAEQGLPEAIDALKSVGAYDMEKDQQYRMAMALHYYHAGEYDESFPMFEELAEEGMPEAMFRLGVCYYWNEGVERSTPKSHDMKKCADWMLKAAELGNSDAMYWLGNYLYGNGEGVEKNETKVIEWLTQAADAHNHKAELSLAICYLTGSYGLVEDKEKGEDLLIAAAKGFHANCVEPSERLGAYHCPVCSREDMREVAFCDQIIKDTEYCIQWLSRAAELGDPEAQNELGKIYLNGTEDIPKDKPKAFELFQQAAAKYLTPALMSLAACYHNGWGTDVDEVEALKNYTLAAEGGDSDAMYIVGEYYANGTGTDKDLKKAVDWYRKAAEQGEVDAQMCLGECYMFGKGVKQDYAESFKWLMEAASRGSVVAQSYVGDFYHQGLGDIEQNDEEAVDWYRKAAEQGQVDAQRHLGFLYMQGDGVEQNSTEGLKWLEKAAEQGDDIAQRNLGLFYMQGLCVEQNFTEGLKWLEKAAEQGDDIAERILDRVR